MVYCAAIDFRNSSSKKIKKLLVFSNFQKTQNGRNYRPQNLNAKT